MMNQVTIISMVAIWPAAETTTSAAPATKQGQEKRIMTWVCAGDQHFDISCVVFDKDGTLMNFEIAWGERIEAWIRYMVSAVDGDESLAEAICLMFGIDPISGDIAIDGPIMSSSMEKMITLSAGVMYRTSGIPWHEAEAIATEAIEVIFGAPLSDEEIQPLGDVDATLSKMREAGITIAVATADEREMSEKCLEMLGIRHHISLLMCGDDPLPQKPDPAVMAWIGSELDADPTSILMVGDTINDMLTGRNGNAAGCIAISPNGSNDSSALAPFADVVLGSIDDLQVGCD